MAHLQYHQVEGGGGGGRGNPDEGGKQQQHEHEHKHEQKEEQVFRLVSREVAQDGKIPRKFTWEGQGGHKDESPPLEWYGVPPHTQSLALIVEDVDAPDPHRPLVPWTHWVLINIPPTLKGLPANFHMKHVDEKSEYASIQEGLNDWKVPGYRGPCPPIGVHRYEFKLYALDTTLKLGHKVTKDKTLDAMEGHVLAVAELVAHYGREKVRTNNEYMPPGGPHHVGSGWPDVLKGQGAFDRR